MTFGNWDEEIHSEPEQVAKIIKASKFEDSQLKIDEKNQSGVFDNFKDEVYELTLNTCTCVSAKDKKPCKHMYLLAMKLGLFDEFPPINPAAKKAFDNEIPNELERFRQLYLNGAITPVKYTEIAKALKNKK